MTLFSVVFRKIIFYCICIYN